MGPQDKPTAAEKRWIDAIVDYGCVACAIDIGRRPGARPAVHHITVAGRRLGHRFSLPLCDPGHHQGGKPLGLISLHPGKSLAFLERYGTEIDLLRQLEDALGFDHEPIPTKIVPRRSRGEKETPP